MTGGSLTVNSTEYVGNSGAGAFTQSAGANNIGFELVLGFNPGATGTYNLSGTCQLNPAVQYIGYSGSGTFTQTGGLNASNNIYLGYSSSSSGAYSLSGNSLLNFENCYVGYSGVVTIAQSGGNADTGNGAPNLYLGFTRAPRALTCFPAPAAFRFDSEYIGNSGSGSMVQAGGSNAASTISLGTTAGSFGSYSLGPNSQVNAGFEYVGLSGTGAFIQTGATNTINSSLLVGGLGFGPPPFGIGTYILTGSGILSAANGEIIGVSGTGTFVQLSGTNSVGFNSGHLTIGNAAGSFGSYSLGGGLLTAGNDEYIGNSGVGSFSQSGGSNIAPNLYVGKSSAGGTYTLSDSGFLLRKGITLATMAEARLHSQAERIGPNLSNLALA